MVKSILAIGNAKYEMDRSALWRFMREARKCGATQAQFKQPQEAGFEALPERFEEAVDRVFDEVIQLYNEYARSQNLGALVRLKSRLEQISLRYKSVALAEEVLNINSCLPYELRVRYCSEHVDGGTGC